MKTILLTTCIVFMTVFLTAQQLPNYNFENWYTQTAWSDPVPFSTFNQIAYADYQTPATIKSTDAHGGLYSAKMQSQGYDSFADMGAVYLGGTGIDGFDEPLPFNGRPDSLVFWSKHDIVDGDFATVVIVFMLDGVQVGNTQVNITGAVNDYVRFSTPIQYLNDSEPNQFGFAAFCTASTYPYINSVLYLDDVSLVYLSTAGDQIPGGDFENWNDMSFDSPEGWSSSSIVTMPNSSVTSSTDAFSGLSARIESQPISNDPTTNVGFLYLGDIFSSTCGSGALYPDNNYIVPLSLSGYYKYLPSKAASDSASIYCMFEYYDDIDDYCYTLGEWTYPLPPTNDWTYFEMYVPSDYYWLMCSQSVFNTNNMVVAFVAAKLDLNDANSPNGPQGSVLFIDELNVQYAVCENVDEHTTDFITLYPNPTEDLLTINRTSVGNAQVQIYDMNGRLILQEQITSTQKQMDVSSLPEGQYTMRLVSDKSTTCKLFVKM